MKKFFALLLLFAGVGAYAQFDGILIEEVDNKGVVPGRTFRVYVKVKNPFDYLTAVYGFKENKLSIRSTKPFFQSAYGGPMANSIVRKTVNEKPELRFDSWVTIGYQDNYNNAVNAFLIEFEDFENGNALETTDGAWYVTPDQKQSKAGEGKKILIGQFTSEGTITGTINIQGRTVTAPDTWETWEVKDISFTCK